MPARSFLFYGALAAAAVLVGGVVGFLVYSAWDLPEVQALEHFRPSITTRVYSDSNRLLAEFFVENRTPVSLADAPEVFLKALVATEDTRFFSHRGLDYRGIARAALRNIRAGKVVEGGSTLTQQLAKVLFLTPERSYLRKLKEMTLALKIEQRYTKQEILALYLNQIYFGSGAYGIESAAQIYFGKSARDLDIAECALLAGIPRSPKNYSPFRSRENAAARRRHVLNRLVATGNLSTVRAAEADRAPLPLHPIVQRKGPAPAPYFVEYVRQKVEERFGSAILYSGGLNIYTSINDMLQEQAERAVVSGLSALEGKIGGKDIGKQPLQAALVAIDPATGHIRAMVGGRDFGASQFNRAWQALRQPGSSFKPVVFAAALERGYSAADLLSDTPITVKVDSKKTWTPENFTRFYQGEVTLRRALAQSLNVPTVRLLSKVGIDDTIRFARSLGIRSPLKPVLPLALGSSDVTLLELTAAYAVFASSGVRTDASAILLITDNTGKTIYANDTIPVQAMKPETAYLVTNLLKGVVEHGTGWKARALGRPVAGKTGTTNDYRDAWFIGYTPALVSGVWVGYDDQRSLGPKATGSRAALPIWLEFMKQAHHNIESAQFNAPPGIIQRSIDPRSGLLSTDRCRASIQEAFLPGTEPRRYCEELSPMPDMPDIQEEAPE